MTRGAARGSGSRRALLGAGVLLTALLILGAWYWFDEDESPVDIQLAALDAQDRVALKKSRVPLLVPKDLRPDDAVVAGEGWYTINTKRKGGYHAISGTTTTHYTLEQLGFDKLPETPYRVNGRPAFVNNAHDVLLGITWSESDAHYALDVECPIGELNCISPEELIEEAEGLVGSDDVEGGAREDGETTQRDNIFQTFLARLSAIISQSAKAQPAEVALWLAKPPRDPGVLVDGSGQREGNFVTPDCGEGNVGFVGKGEFGRNHVFAPDIIFPIQSAPAYANSQVYGPGRPTDDHPGVNCATLDEGEPEYSYPWGDNFCEHRSAPSAVNALCPVTLTGQSVAHGHQGQDIRAMDKNKGVHPVVAVVDGSLSFGSFSVQLTATSDGTKYRYLHGCTNNTGCPNTASTSPKQGEIIAFVDGFTNSPQTTTPHVHFEIRRTVAGFGFTYMPPYTSLIKAYQKLIGVEAPRCTITTPADQECTYPK